jgi:hypothetical protein
LINTGIKIYHGHTAPEAKNSLYRYTPMIRRGKAMHLNDKSFVIAAVIGINERESGIEFPSL